MITRTMEKALSCSGLKTTATLPQNLTQELVTPKQEKKKPDKRHYVYILQSITNPNRTYVGYTVNPSHRLRQHNKEIKGGAKYTSVGGPYEMICCVSGFADQRSALQFEWRCHHPSGKPRRKCSRFNKFKGVERRCKILQYVLGLDRWTYGADGCKSHPLVVHWLSPNLQIRCANPHTQEIFIGEE